MAHPPFFIDIVFVRTWFIVLVPKFYNPVTTLLLPLEEKVAWQGMKTLGQLKREKGVRHKPNEDSLYKVSVCILMAASLMIPWLPWWPPTGSHCNIYDHSAVGYVTCRIKTGHSNLMSCFGPRMRALARYFTSAFTSVKYLSQHPHPRAKTWHKIWMTSLNPNYDTIPIPSLQNSQNKCQKSSFTYDRRRHFILPLPPVHALPTLNAHTCCLGAPIDDVTISYFQSHGQFESSLNASCQRISIWIIRTPIMHIDELHND